MYLFGVYSHFFSFKQDFAQILLTTGKDVICHLSVQNTIELLYRLHRKWWGMLENHHIGVKKQLIVSGLYKYSSKFLHKLISFWKCT